jgi:UDP-N-acetylmuramate dehydrogenase
VKVEEGVSLSRFTTLGAGGPATGFARPESVEGVEAALAWARERGVAVATIGLGSNLLVADEGFDGLVLKLAGGSRRPASRASVSSQGAGRPTRSASTACVRPGSAASSSPARSRGRSAAASG